jgi:protein-S-isoprenylcysteine O-methyltransferase Ste14
MALREELEANGNRLFRWRSYLPLALMPMAALALWGYRRPFGTLAGHEAWAALCAAVSFTGLVVRIATVGFVPRRTSGRNVRGQRADALNTTGIYSTVRHPLYVGNFLLGLGTAAFLANGWVVAAYTLIFWLYYERIMFAEEEFLRRTFGAEFEEWAAVTPAFVPSLSRWRPPARSFSARFALRREASTLLSLLLPLLAFETLERLTVDRRLTLDAAWIAWLACAATTFAAYAALRALKTRTDVLAPRLADSDLSPSAPAMSEVRRAG